MCLWLQTLSADTMSFCYFNHFVSNVPLVADPASGHNEFLCPITMEIMKDPVIAAGTHIFISLVIPSLLSTAP